MEYSMSDYVVVYTNDVKQIESMEIICGVEIYYMSDNTSYALRQILRCANKEEIVNTFINKVKNNGDIIMQEFYDKKQFLVDSMVKWINENVK